MAKILRKIARKILGDTKYKKIRNSLITITPKKSNRIEKSYLFGIKGN
ncbi:hypothetical protein [Bacillus sp. m3-13]|nr:hypothetical protein [Bacillus sp. m3-13]